MIKITLKELWARKLRLFTTGIAVLLGVAFMSGTLVLGDTVSKTFDDLGQTIVMVTHDPGAASRADRIVFLADGRVVDEMLAPTAERVLDRMKRFGD